jgi:hypothetical protein
MEVFLCDYLRHPLDQAMQSVDNGRRIAIPLLIERSSMARMNAISRQATNVALLVGSLLLGLISCDPDTQRQVEAAASKAAGVVSNITVDPDAGIVDGEPDAGFLVKYTVANTGEQGLITLTTRLSTSEGEWSRQQRLSFAAGETMTVSYFFHEPTVNAKNIQATVNVFPKPSKKP